MFDSVVYTTSDVCKDKNEDTKNSIENSLFMKSDWFLGYEKQIKFLKVVTLRRYINWFWTMLCTRWTALWRN